MNILLASSSSGSRGGGEIFLLYLARGLKELGHKPSLWCSTHNRMDELADSFEELGTVFRTDYPNSYFERRTRALGAWLDKKTAHSIAKHWESLNPDIIHLNLQTPEDGIDLVKALKQIQCPGIITTHITQSAQSLKAKGGLLRDTVVKKAYSSFPSRIPIITVSDGRKKELQTFLNSCDNIQRIYNGVPPASENQIKREDFLESMGWPKDSLLVCDLARLTSQKNPFAFLDAAEKLLLHHPQSRFIWVGDGPMKEDFLNYSEQKNIRDKVHVTGWTQDPGSHLSISDIYLHPALFEGLPLAILEAMQAGLPCILPASLIAEADVLNEQNCILLDESETWIKKITTSETRERIQEASKTCFHEHFTHTAMAKQYLKYYQAIQ